ncbi:hypothetical protein NC99_01780 [Sunxiuqinia dokdonensis]|uniref:Uncharacterized protein n=1 Tax=Sunxiuqinia dokdonensis TaxID=1409788 RepID=A0A0L8VEU3_9BACT|nr:hypothetical protein NC99_01780 [Sunxiuqinia dokdonensis]
MSFHKFEVLKVISNQKNRPNVGRWGDWLRNEAWARLGFLVERSAANASAKEDSSYEI